MLYDGSESAFIRNSLHKWPLFCLITVITFVMQLIDINSEYSRVQEAICVSTLFPVYVYLFIQINDTQILHRF